MCKNIVYSAIIVVSLCGTSALIYQNHKDVSTAEKTIEQEMNNTRSLQQKNIIAKKTFSKRLEYVLSSSTLMGYLLDGTTIDPSDGIWETESGTFVYGSLSMSSSEENETIEKCKSLGVACFDSLGNLLEPDEGRYISTDRKIDKDIYNLLTKEIAEENASMQDLASFKKYFSTKRTRQYRNQMDLLERYTNFLLSTKGGSYNAQVLKAILFPRRQIDILYRGLPNYSGKVVIAEFLNKESKIVLKQAEHTEGELFVVTPRQYYANAILSELSIHYPDGG